MKQMKTRLTALVLALAMMLSCSVSVFAATDPEKHNMEYELEYTGDSDNDRVDLKELIYDGLAYEFDWENDVELEYYDIWTDDNDYEVYDEDLDYGKINSKDVYIVELTDSDKDDLYETEELYENYIYYDAEDSDGYEYYGRIEIIIVDEGDYDDDYDLDEDLIYEIDYETELDLGLYMIEDLEYLMNDDLNYVEFTIPTDAGDCGEIYYYYATNQWETLDDTKRYYAYPTTAENALDEVYFESNDEGGEFVFEYYAIDEDGEELEGYVTIFCGESIVVEIDIDADEVYEFDPEDFEDAVEEWDDRYTLNYIEGVKLENSHDGELVDVAGKDVSTKTAYYVNDEDNLIEDITFEPSSRASDVIISFTANVQRGSKKAENVAGILKITVNPAADITIKAGVGDLIDIDWEIFQEYLEEDADSTTYDVAYVTIKDAPRSDNDGYLVTDGEELKTEGEKTFYIDPAKKQYDLEDLQYQAGEKKGTHKATFKVYYYKTASSTTATASTEGKIKFEVTETQPPALPNGAKFLIDSVEVRSPYTDSLLDAIPPNDFYAEVEVTNYTSTDRATLLLAVYAESGEMIDLGFLYADPAVGQTVTFGTLIRNADGRAHKIKAFLWTSLSNPVPLAEAKAFPEELPDLSGDVVLGYGLTPGLVNGQLVNVMLPDGTTGSLGVVETDGVSWEQADLSLPDFFLHRVNGNSQSTLTTLKTAAEYRACGIYAGFVSKYIYKTDSVILDNGAELTAADTGFTLYDGSFAVSDSGLECVERKEPYIFFAPEGEAVYGVHATGEALEALYVKLGGTLPEKGDPWEGVIVANEYADLYGDTPLKKDQTRVRYTDENGEEQYVTFTNWSTGLAEIGEYRTGTAEGDVMLTVGGKEQNAVFQTGMETTVDKASQINGLMIDADTQYFTNFAEVENQSFSRTGNGDWLRVVDNDDDGYAEYVFFTVFEMTEVVKVAGDEIRLANGNRSDAFMLSEDVESGDIVLYTAIDGVEYVELADTVIGKVEKYTYKTDTLTVNGEDYSQSHINYSSIEDAYFSWVEDAAKNIEYIFYLDFFGNIRVYGRDREDRGESVLLTDAYYATGRAGIEAAVDAYLNGAITDVDVDYDTKYTDVAMFIDSAAENNAWGRLIAYSGDAQAWTNIARTVTDEEGVMSLYTAQTRHYNTKGEAVAIKGDYVDLDEVDVEAGQTTYYGIYDGASVKVQTNKNTVYYYVDGNMNIQTVTGYKNSLDVIDAYVGINAMYAVATNVNSDASDERYWVADVIVIETQEPAFTLGNDVVLGYNVVNKTVSDYASLDVIGTNGALNNLNVINFNGFNSFEAEEIVTPAFYFNTEDEDGNSHIRIINTAAGYEASSIYAGTIDRANKLLDYVVTTDGNTLYFDENTEVYDLTAGTRVTSITAEDEYEDALTLEKGRSYILVTDGDDTVVYAILVEDADDIAAALYTEISGNEPTPGTGTQPEPSPEPAAEKPLVLLTDAYFETNRNGKEAAVDAYLNGSITEMDVDFDADYTDVEMYIAADTHNNSWGKLIAYGEDPQCWTNLAAYTVDEAGVMSLYTATAYNYNERGEQVSVKRDYIDLYEQDVEAGQTTYSGSAYGEEIRVQATENTVFYYVDGDLGIQTVTGYQNSLDVIGELSEINAMYAVATTAADGNGEPYWVAEVIVVETEYETFTLGNDVVLAYNVSGKTADNGVLLEVIDSDGTLSMLEMTNGNGYNIFEPSDIPVPAFYFNTVKADGTSHIRAMFDYYHNGVFACRLDRVNKLMDYVIAMDGTIFYVDEATTVYDLKAKTNHNTAVTTDTYDEPLTLETGEAYILVVDENDTIIYAIWVEAYDDFAADLYAEISGEVVDPLGLAKLEAKDLVVRWIYDYCEPTYGVTEVELSDMLTEVLCAVEDAETVEAVEAIVFDGTLNIRGTGITALEAYAQALVAAKIATVTIISDKAVIVNGRAYTGPVEAMIGDTLTLVFASDVIVTAEGATCATGESMNTWTVTICANTVTVTVAQ